MSVEHLLMLDSGAFSVWSAGAKIDIDDYVRFCAQHPGVDYYVNLDVIPGRPGVPRTTESIVAACKEGWQNYLKMIRVLPQEKVIPVYHRGESFEWLEKYLDSGATYIGIGLAGKLGTVTEEKKDWMKDIKGYICDSSGKPTVKVHGFAVTSFRMMKILPWHSVDSASWIRTASYGHVYIPKMVGGEYQYDVDPLKVNFSPKSPSMDVRGQHITNLPPTLKLQVEAYLQSIKMRMGEFEIVYVDDDHKRQEGELQFKPKIDAQPSFFDDDVPTGKKVLRILSKGLMTCHQRRFWANAVFIQRANDVLPPDHIYFAGACGSLVDRVEYNLGRRLLSYNDVRKVKASKAVFDKYMEMAQARAA